MHVDGGLDFDPGDAAVATQSVHAAHRVGYQRLFTSETAHDPFLPLAVAADAARSAGIDLGTNIAVALARSPMTTAASARDLHVMTGGRFILGLGSQVKPHITRRFSMPWSHPAARMREFTMALRAIWASWEEGTKLSFKGDFYNHTLSVPMFDPGPTGVGHPRVFLAAVGPRMTEVAGEVADGLFCHTFTSPAYLRAVTLPALRAGAVRAGRDAADLEVTVPVMIATGPVGADLEREVEQLRSTIAFYGSTPAYAGVLEQHGWADLHNDLHALSTRQRWDEMPAVVDDTVLHTLGIVADAGTLAQAVRERFGGLVTGVRLNVPYAVDEETWAPVVASLRQPEDDQRKADMP